MARNLIRARAGSQVIHRQRRQHRPPLLHNFAALGPMLAAYQRIRQIYQAETTAQDGSIAYIFGSNVMLQRLGEVNEWHTDGTFQVNICVY